MRIIILFRVTRRLLRWDTNISQAQHLAVPVIMRPTLRTHSYLAQRSITSSLLHQTHSILHQRKDTIPADLVDYHHHQVGCHHHTVLEDRQRGDPVEGDLEEDHPEVAVEVLPTILK